MVQRRDKRIIPPIYSLYLVWRLIYSTWLTILFFWVKCPYKMYVWSNISFRNFGLISDWKLTSQRFKCGGTVNGDKVERATQILNYKILEIPFVFLGISVGTNPRQRETWKSMIEKFERRLVHRKQRHLWVGNCVSLTHCYYLYLFSSCFFFSKLSLSLFFMSFFQNS